MPTRLFAIFIVIGVLTACTSSDVIQPADLHPTEYPPAGVDSGPATAKLTPASTEEPEPSYKVAAFYYPWYENPTVDGQWIHWMQNNHLPPQDIASDYYPALGAYSSNDPAVVEQHMRWLRQAGIGVIITSWWGQGSREDKVVPLLLQTAKRYEIKVTFHIEPYNGRTAESLASDVQYLYEQYGSHPAFFRSTATSRYSPGAEQAGMFFVWSIGAKGAEENPYRQITGERPWMLSMGCPRVR